MACALHLLLPFPTATLPLLFPVLPSPYRPWVWGRIEPTLWAQSGDWEFKNGTGGRSVYGLHFKDESHKLKHTGRGVVSMVVSRPNTSNSQFMIALDKTEWRTFGVGERRRGGWAEGWWACKGMGREWGGYLWREAGEGEGGLGGEGHGREVTARRAATPGLVCPRRWLWQAGRLPGWRGRMRSVGGSAADALMAAELSTLRGGTAPPRLAPRGGLRRPAANPRHLPAPSQPTGD